MQPVTARRCLLAALALAPALAVAGLPDFPAPDDAEVSRVADDVTVAGRTMSVRAFVTDDEVADVVAFYQELWKDPPVEGAPGVAYEPEVMAPWHLLTRVEDDYVMTVQVMEARNGGAFGFLALGRLPEPGQPPAKPPAPPSMQGSSVGSDIESVDDGKRARTAMLTNQNSPQSNADFYRSHYSGWRKDIDQALGNGQLHALSFTRGREQVIVTIQSDGNGGSRIVLNSIEHDLL